MVLYLSSSSFEPSWAGELLIWARGYRISEEGKVIVGQDKQSKPPGGSGHGAGLQVGRKERKRYSRAWSRYCPSRCSLLAPDRLT